MTADNQKMFGFRHFHIGYKHDIESVFMKVKIIIMLPAKIAKPVDTNHFFDAVFKGTKVFFVLF